MTETIPVVAHITARAGKEAEVVSTLSSLVEPTRQEPGCIHSWLFFGKQGIITENDAEEQEKRLKYLDLVASAVILQNPVDISYAIQSFSAEGHKIEQACLAVLSPYMTRQSTIPQPLEGAIT